MKSTFKLLDSENKGYISPEKSLFLLQSFGETNVELEDIATVFRWLKNDTEGEGFLNYQDFVSVFKKYDEKVNV